MKSATTPKDSSANNQRNNNMLRGRERRLALALLAAPAGLSRESADSAAYASNGPDVIRRLRARDVAIRTEMRTFVTIDGERSRYGVYHLHDCAHECLRELLEGNRNGA